MTISVHHQSNVLLDSVPNGWWTSLPKDWFGKPVVNPPSFTVGLSEEHLFFAGKREAAPVTITEARLGECVEGLWKFDAAELFVKNPASDQYFEINLGPQSAWWLGVFSNYRKPDDLFPKPVLENIKPELSWSHIREDSWSAGVIFPRRDLPFALDEKNLLLNATFCLSAPERSFVTAQSLSSAEPDFHKIGNITAARIVED